MRKIPELALPAGSLQCALYAFKGGADAVYLGMKKFSARKAAVNFTFEELRKLKTFCIRNCKKFYVTVNTLLTDEDIPLLLEQLKELDYIKPDGIIVQDLGVAAIIRNNFPHLELHASTQLAVHNTEGVKVLKDLGFSRVVLSRELSFDEIMKIRESCPDIEIKVFIHGALCYGFSGICMASERITGRSANCGACAQICRTWFTNDSTGEDSYCFSMKDLCLGELVNRYAEIGIDSLKIEGRMKSPEYVFHTARYYRRILDGSGTNSEQEDSMKAAFSRLSTIGFFNQRFSGSMNAEKMICDKWPGHIGFKVGTIRKVSKGKALIHFEKPVSLRDGILVLYKGKSAGFALSEIQGKKSFVNSGEIQTVNFPSEEFTALPETGTPVYCTSRHNQTLSLIAENISLFKAPVDIEIRLENNKISVNDLCFPVKLQMAKSQIDCTKNFADVFSASDKSFFTLGKLTISNKSPFENPFIPLSVIKDIRRKFYAELDADFICKKIDVKDFGCSIIRTQKDNSFFELNPLNFTDTEPVIPEGFDKIVLNNISQVFYARRHPENAYYSGPFLYVKNRFAYGLLNEIIPNFKGICTVVQKDIPLFTSRVCYRHNALGKPCSGCSKNNSYSISQNGKKYRVICKDCITTVFEL